MAKTDDHIRDLFTEKLSGFESPVNPRIWSGIESALPAPAAPVSGVSAAKGTSSVLSWVIGAVAAAGIVTAAYFISADTADSSAPVTAEVTTPPSGEQADTEASEDALPMESGVSESKTATAPLLSNPISTDSRLEQANDLKAPVATPSTMIDGTVPALPSDDSFSTGEAPFRPASDLDVDPSNSGASGGTQTYTAENLTAMFNIVPVDPASLRWFFFPAAENALTYHWNFGNGEESWDRSPALSYDEEGEYEVSLEVTGQNGQTQRHEILLKAYKPASLGDQNVFTPNGDGDNDRFDILAQSTGISALQQFIVFDSRGRLLFESTTDSAWNGNGPDGNPSPEGTYFYVVRYRDNLGETHEDRGSFNLFR